MGNFKPPARRTAQSCSGQRTIRSVLRSTIGPDAENRPSDLKLIAAVMKDAGLLSPDTPPEKLRQVIFGALRHVERTISPTSTQGLEVHGIKPAGHSERTMRRAIAEMRFPVTHQQIVQTTAPRGAKAIIDKGVSVAQRRVLHHHAPDVTPPMFRRALLPPIAPDVFQANRRLAETLGQCDVNGLDVLIAESMRLNSKQGFVDVRNFFAVLETKNPGKMKLLAINVKRRLQGKPRRRFIKLLQHVPPNEDDFTDQAS